MRCCAWFLLITWSAFQVNSSPSAISCTQCEDVVGIIADFAGNSTSVGDMIKYLDQTLCTTFPNNETQAVCDAVVAGVVNIFPGAERELMSLAWNAEAVCATLLHVCTINCCLTTTQPEQVHLSWVGNDPSQMGVTWMTLQPTATSTVAWTLPGQPWSNAATATGQTHTYTKGDWNGVIHTAVMTELQPATVYVYRVGDANAGWSPQLTFTTLGPDVGVSTPLRVLVIGDMGYDNTSTATVNAMIQLANQNAIDMVIHNGDISYADGYMRHWDMFLRKVQPVASRVPYMVTPGNHEFWFNFTAYKARFFMPRAGSGDNMFYSWNVGSVHFLAMDTETQIDTANLGANQVTFMESDLRAVNANRTAWPWIIAYGHRPFYCSDHAKHYIECKTYAEILRAKAELMFYLNHVNLVISAHLHSYERMWPVFEGKVSAHSYNNPTAPVYMMNGAAGNREGNDNPPGDQPYSAFHSGDVGFAIMTIQKFSLQWDFYASANVSIIDSITINI